MVLNIPIISFNSQVIFDSKRYLKQFLSAYYHTKLIRKPDWVIYLHDYQLIKRPSLKINFKKSIARIYLPKRILLYNYASFLVETAISVFALREKILFLHASSLVKNKSAYIFCGKRGAGKSTIINLGNKMPSLSDDTAIITKFKSKYYIYPSPFDQNKIKNNIFMTEVLLEKIFFIKQDKYTFIKSIDNLKSLQLLRKQSLPMYYNSQDSSLCPCLYKILLDIVKNIEIQRLHFAKTIDFLYFLR